MHGQNHIKHELYLRIQSVPRSEHSPSQLPKHVSLCCIGK